jgi:glycosyltransferase involved in cell wall biosynthesis
MRVVGVSLIRNEDLYVEQSLRNVSGFCDSIVVADHMSTDRTWEIVSALASDLGNLEVHRVAHSAESHALIERFAGTDTWVLSIDGDELYDPSRLPRFRDALERGTYDGVFRIRPAAIHCDVLDRATARATGHLSPPSRPLVGILNFGAIESWTGVRSERLHGGDIVFRPGFDMDSWCHLGSEGGWTASPFRALHLCFLPRSSTDAAAGPATGRPNLAETRRYRRGVVGGLEGIARRVAGRRSPTDARWKAEKYRRGEATTVDISAFFP